MQRVFPDEFRPEKFTYFTLKEEAAATGNDHQQKGLGTWEPQNPPCSDLGMRRNV